VGSYPHEVSEITQREIFDGEQRQPKLCVCMCVHACLHAHSFQTSFSILSFSDLLVVDMTVPFIQIFSCGLGSTP
jgi:hypothetical protein